MQVAEIKKTAFMMTDKDTHDNLYSNAIAFLDIAPRFSRGKIKKINVDDAKHSSINRSFQFEGVEYDLKILPMLSEEDDGSFLIFASDREEKIEAAVMKIASDGQLELDDKSANTQFYVSFTLYRLQEVLKSAGHKMSYSDMRQGLDVLSSSIIKITRRNKNGTSEYSGPYFPERIYETKAKRGRETDVVKLRVSSLHERAILNGDYRQYLYSIASKFKKPLARWIYMHLVHNWKNVGIGGRHITKTIIMSEVLISYGYNRQGRTAKVESRDVLGALKELHQRGIIEQQPRATAIEWDENEYAIDYKYEIKASSSFISNQIQSNAKAKGLASFVGNGLKKIESME
jgi:hypothetical protein